MKENHHTEFKSNWKDDFLKNVCAFANSEGGFLYIGLDDQGNPVGVKNISTLLETLPNIISQKIGIIPVIEVENIGEKQIVKIIIQTSSVPISYQGRYYLRSGSVVIELKGRELGDFLLRKSGTTWDSLEIAENWEFEPDPATVELFKKLSFDRLPFAKDEPDVQLLIKKLNLLTSSLSPTRAAFLLFDKNPQRYFPQAVIKIGRFINEADIVSSDIVGGNLFQQAENALAILRTKYLLSTITYEGAHRRETMEYPFGALRESIFNALIHRDYNTTSAIQIKIYNTSLSIANEGKLPPEITIADLKREHLSKPRNKLLADIFYKAGFIESRGRGTLKIIRDCKEARIPEPYFFEDHGVVKIIFKLATSQVNSRNGELNSELNGELNSELNYGQQKNFKEIMRNPGINSSRIAKNLTIPFSTVDKHISVLQKLGLVERRGSKKTGGYWEIPPAGNKNK